MNSCVLFYVTVGMMHLCATMCFTSDVSPPTILFLCLCAQLSGLLLFSTNGGQVVVAQIDHGDGLAQPPR